MAHAAHPYPNKAEWATLVRQTGKPPEEVYRWFATMRFSTWSKLRHGEREPKGAFEQELNRLMNEAVRVAEAAAAEARALAAAGGLPRPAARVGSPERRTHTRWTRPGARARASGSPDQRAREADIRPRSANVVRRTPLVVQSAESEFDQGAELTGAGGFWFNIGWLINTG